jgi:uncharacterized protein (DUF488 family)
MKIWTIGHSNRTWQEFVNILNNFSIEILADIRTFPGSRKYPYFNKEAMSGALNNVRIKYIHLPELGGRRKPLADSINTAWRNSSFQGYADHMRTEEFHSGISRLIELANESRVAYMCSEAVWWNCHRALVSDYLKKEGWQVLHIQDLKKATEHPYTSPARVEQGNLFYD